MEENNKPVDLDNGTGRLWKQNKKAVPEVGNEAATLPLPSQGPDLGPSAFSYVPDLGRLGPCTLIQ